MRIQRISLVVIIVIGTAAFLFAQDKPDDVIKIDTALINIPVIVSDRDNRYLPGLGEGNFKVYQDGVEQKIAVFNNDAAPISIVLALDTSLSTFSVLGKIKKAAKAFINSLATDDRAMIVSFDNDVHILSPLTTDQKRLREAINDAEIGERAGTVLNDALYQTIRKSLKNVRGRKAIILLTDGKDHGSYYSKSDLTNGLNESDTVIYPIFYETDGGIRRAIQSRFPDLGGMGRYPGGGRRRAGRFPGRGGNRPNADADNESAIQFLQQLADITGGRFFKEKKADLKDAFRQIADEMKRQYLLGYYPTEDSAIGTLHKVKVRVDRPGAVVRSKSAYRTQAR